MDASPQTDQAEKPKEPTLRRSIGPAQMALYGLGSMLGAGIYGLIGKAAGLAGNAVWLAFVVAFAAALATGLTYASLGSRYPRAAGAAYITQRAFGQPILSFVVGLALICSGLTSVATQAHVFAANLAALLAWDSLPTLWLAAAFLLVMAAVVFRGIRESVWVNVVCTVIEAGGLLLIVAVGVRYWGSVDYLQMPQHANLDAAWLIVLQGAVLSFFAFIGFEDTLNIAEEVRDPARTLPIGLIVALGATALIYLAVAITAVSVLPWQELAAAPGPMTAVMARAAPSFPPIIFTVITLFAVANTALVNFVTASRLIYGMSRQGLLPQWLGRVHFHRQTPHVAIFVLLLVALALALAGTITELAAATVLLLLSVFAILNLALIVLQRRVGEPKGKFEIPPVIPACGLAISLVLLLTRVFTGDLGAPIIAGVLVAASVAIYFAMRPNAIPGGA